LSSLISFLLFILLFYRSRTPRALHSFPTRRSSDLQHRHVALGEHPEVPVKRVRRVEEERRQAHGPERGGDLLGRVARLADAQKIDRKSTRLNSSHRTISYAVFCLKKKKKKTKATDI